MINRIKYALTMAFRYRKALSAYRRNKALQCQSILTLDPIHLRAGGIKIIALDFDGVLASHGATEIGLEMRNWLNLCIQIFAPGHVFILTNKPSTERADYFSAHFRGVKFIFPKRKKPYPDSILSILQKTQMSPSELLVVDDRLLTGILAAIIAGVRGCYITEPLVDLHKHSLSELFIMSLRKLERWLL
ncbi:MAG TPA: HAD hydrolase-like protein [Gammaproteobacteria bacterium]|nr:HAD hydrolase-like protein [Gammaproteobacteria bacterium]